MSRNTMGQFLPGTGGRRPGTRNRLQGSFIRALCKDFEEHGEAVIRICRVEKPTEYLKIIASTLPKEYLFIEDGLDNLSDEELVDAIESIKRKRAEHPASETAH